METRVLELVNAHRKSIGLGELQFNEVIYAEALKHSKDMANGVVPFSHDGFDGRADRLMNKVGGNAIAENVASGQPDAESVLESWLESTGHKQNIEGSYNLTGIGIARSKDGELYFTQIFLLKKPFKK
ncbi:MAG: CAP domain-containing protein [Bacteroidales bacterium]|nr:CAP domain-containing protein [Bacteroidales bacterium]